MITSVGQVFCFADDNQLLPPLGLVKEASYLALVFWLWINGANKVLTVG